MWFFSDIQGMLWIRGNRVWKHILQEKIESSTDILKRILQPVVGIEEVIAWSLNDPEPYVLMDWLCHGDTFKDHT